MIGNSNRGGKRLYASWIFVFIIVVFITILYQKGDGGDFFGIAESREITINSEAPVEIQKINVIEGESVEKGRRLVELRSPELSMKINSISHQLDKLKAQTDVDATEILSTVQQLSAEKASKIGELSFQIRELENRYNMNRHLLSGLSSVGDLKDKDLKNPLTMKIESLKKEMELQKRRYDLRISLLRKSLQHSKNPNSIQIAQLEKELEMLRNENNSLTISASHSGIVGSINFKAGEKAAPFSSIMTLYRKTPTFIKGYIHENKHTSVSLGEQIGVYSLSDPRNVTTGTVVGMGNRIVQYPGRLLKHPEMILWGREVIIKIPSTNSFILGEKVRMSSLNRKNSLLNRLANIFKPSSVQAGEKSVKNSSGKKPASNKKSPEKAEPITTLKTGSLEASAILYIPELERYAVLSDDTPGKKPIIFLMNSSGRITDEIRIEGLKKIDDTESIAIGRNNNLYIASSQSHSKKGKLKKRRRLLTKVNFSGKRFSLAGKVDLYTLLKKAAEVEKNLPWARFILSGVEERSIDIESMFYDKGDLYLGYKAPLDGKDSVILRIKGIDTILAGKKVEKGTVSIWKRIKLEEDFRISDLLKFGDDLYITATRFSAAKGGKLFLLRKEILSTVRNFENLRPEGISATNDPDTLILTFDQGGKMPSSFLKIKVTP